MPLRRRHGPGAAVPTAPEAQKAGGGARRSRPGSSRPHLSLGQMQTSRGLQLTRRQRGQAGRCGCDRPAPKGGCAAPRGMWGTLQSALGAAGVDAGTSRRHGANEGPTTTTSTSVGITNAATSAMTGHHAAGEHAAAEDRRTWGRGHLGLRLGSGTDVLLLLPACRCRVACFEHRANGSGMHSGMRAAHRPVEQHRPGTDHAGQRRGGAPSAGAPVTSPARPRRRDPRDGRYDPLSLQLGVARTRIDVLMY